MFKLEINCDSSAFQPIIGDELARILTQIAKGVEGCEPKYLNGSCYDYNGNKVGRYTFKTKQERKVDDEMPSL